MFLPQFLIPGVVAAFVVVLGLAFIFWYWRPSRRIRNTLKAVIPAIEALKPKDNALNGPVDRAVIQKILKRDATLLHLWDEYTETLHEQSDVVDGERRVVAIRATVPAEVFFNTQVLVDTPLNTEFFRHLPGLLTGIGIIGTFSGLIHGLSGFEPTGSAETVKASLGALMEGVQEAFYASAFAIGAAMLVTFIEKRELNRRYKQIEQLTQVIDALYEAGAGEEYLARLVKAAEESATQTKQLKQSLVDDLKQILTDLTERQIQASQLHSQQMADLIGTAIRSLLQGAAVQDMLAPLVTKFIEQIEATFGDLTQQTAKALQETRDALGTIRDEMVKLTTNIGSASQAATDGLAGKLKETIDAADGRQQRMEDQMAAIVANLEGQRTTAAQAEQEHLNNIAGKTKDLVDGLAGETDRLTAEVLKAVQAMGTSIDKMNSGAQDMYLAATEFKDAGNAVTGVMRQGAVTMGELRAASEQVGTASTRLSEVMTTSLNAQLAIQGMIEALKGIVEQAKREAGVSQQIVADMNEVSEKLSEVEQQTRDYLGKMTELIDRAFADFGTAVSRELGTSNAVFQRELGQGTELLKAAFTELAAVIGQFQAQP
jgi:biopolymer transport protein ExbB/TolQ